MNAAKRISALFLSCVLLLAPLCGCGNDDEHTPTLRVMSILGDEGCFEAYSSLISGFTAEHPEVFLRDTTAETADAYRLSANIESTYTSSNAPHVVYYYSDTGIDDLRDYFVSVEEIRETYPDFASNIPETAFDCVRSEDGNVYCVPLMCGWNAVAVNTSIFDRLSLGIPNDLSSLKKVAEVLSASDVIPFANSPDDCDHFLSALISAKDPDALLDGLSGKDEVLAPAWLEAFAEYGELCESDVFAPAAMTDEISGFISDSDVKQYSSVLGERNQTRKLDALELFNSGKAAMMAINSEELSDVTVETLALVGYPLSDGVSGSVVMGSFSSGFYITRKAFNDMNLREFAVGLVSRLTSDEAGSAFAALGFIPAASEAGGEPELMKEIFAAAGSQERWLPDTASSGYAARWNDIESKAAELYFGVITPEQAIQMLEDNTIETADLLAVLHQEVSPSDAAEAA